MLRRVAQKVGGQTRFLLSLLREAWTFSRLLAKEFLGGEPGYALNPFARIRLRLKLSVLFFPTLLTLPMISWAESHLKLVSLKPLLLLESPEEPVLRRLKQALKGRYPR